MIILFYDSQYDLCLKGINYYQRIAPPNMLNWQDITLSITFLLL